MEIHFCDLCNESVPDSDLAAGKAFMRKGRVVCAKCDALMSPPGTPAEPAVKVQEPVLAAAPATPIVPVAAAAPHAAAEHPRVHLRHGSGAGFGVAVGLFSILLTALAVWFLYDRAEATRIALEGELRVLSDEASMNAASAERRALELEHQIDALGMKLAAELGEAQRSLAAGLERGEAQSAATLAKVEAFRGDLASMQETIGLIRRHESEMLSLQQKFSELSAEVGALGSVLAALEQTQRNQAAVHEPPKAPQAPWLGILPQLESANSGDRWTAVQQLGETRDPAVADHLLPLLKDADIFVRMATARVLGDLGAPRATPALIDALEDAEFPVREAAYVALVAVSKRNLPFDAMADPAERAKRVKAWRDWWKKEGGGAGA
jgi:hypothetical protein